MNTTANRKALQIFATGAGYSVDTAEDADVFAKHVAGRLIYIAAEYTTFETSSFTIRLNGKRVAGGKTDVALRRWMIRLG